MSRDTRKYEADPLAAERIRQALARPVEERKKIELPRPKPVDELNVERQLKPAPRIVRKNVPR